MSHFFHHLLQSIFRTVVIFLLFSVFFFLLSWKPTTFSFRICFVPKCVRNVYSLIGIREKNENSHNIAMMLEYVWISCHSEVDSDNKMRLIVFWYHVQSAYTPEKYSPSRSHKMWTHKMWFSGLDTWFELHESPCKYFLYIFWYFESTAMNRSVWLCAKKLTEKTRLENISK